MNYYENKEMDEFFAEERAKRERDPEYKRVQLEKEGSIECRKCGTIQNIKNTFCFRCGNKLN